MTQCWWYFYMKYNVALYFASKHSLLPFRGLLTCLNLSCVIIPQDTEKHRNRPSLLFYAISPGSLHCFLYTPLIPTGGANANCIKRADGISGIPAQFPTELFPQVTIAEGLAWIVLATRIRATPFRTIKGEIQEVGLSRMLDMAVGLSRACF